MYGEHVRERVAAPGARTHGFVGRQIETHVESGRGETAVEQRACGNAERQVDRLAQKGGQGTLAGGSGGIGTVAILQRLGERAERPLLIVVFVTAADIVKRLKITHASTISQPACAHAHSTHHRADKRNNGESGIGYHKDDERRSCPAKVRVWNTTIRTVILAHLFAVYHEYDNRSDHADHR